MHACKWWNLSAESPPPSAALFKRCGIRVRARIRLAALAGVVGLLCASGSARAQCIDYGDYIHWAGSVATGPAYGVTVSGTHAYVAGYFGLQVIDISNPQSPQIVGSVDTPGSANGVAVAGTYAYVADWYPGLQVIDISNPESPQIVGSVDTPSAAIGVTVSGTLAYVTDQTSGLHRHLESPEPPDRRERGHAGLCLWGSRLGHAHLRGGLDFRSSGFRHLESREPPDRRDRGHAGRCL
jgi:hypothetical protein